MMKSVPTLPPGQRAVRGFPRFGAHFAAPVPAIPDEPVIEIAGAVCEPFSAPVSDLAGLPRHQVTAGLHCVVGWTAVGAHWEGVAFAEFYRRVIEPALAPRPPVTHLVFEGVDGYRSVALLTDVLADDVLLAERLDGRPLPAEHGAPVRLVSPDQYGYVSTKHLCRIELHTREPVVVYHPRRRIHLGLQLVKPHPRARVWHEERHRYLPAGVVRPVYRQLVPLFRRVGALGQR